MPDLELLADHDVSSCLSEHPRGGEAHHSGADDGDLGVGTRLHDRSVALSGVGAGEQLEQLGGREPVRLAVVVEVDPEASRLLVHAERQLSRTAL